MALELLCLGLTTLDVVVRPVDRLPEGEEIKGVEEIEVAPAGTAAGTAMVAATLGVRTGLAGAVGDDRKGRFVRMGLAEASVDTAWLETTPHAATSTTILVIDSDGRRPGFHASGAGFDYRLTDQALQAAKTARYVHWGGVGCRQLDGGPGAGLLQAAREAGAVVSCDLIAPRRGALEELKRLLPFVNTFLPSAVEARTLTGKEDLIEAAHVFIGLGAQACIVKNGAAGCVMSLEGQDLRLLAHPITPVDTTSCGDSFCAGFVAGLLHGYDPLEAARFATTTAALVAQGLGTLGRLGGFADVRAAMDAWPYLQARS